MFLLRFLRPEQYFPFALIILMLGAAAGYGLSGDPRRCIYWFAAAVLNTAITF